MIVYMTQGQKTVLSRITVEGLPLHYLSVGGAISPAAVLCTACVRCMTPVSAAVSAPMFTSFRWRSR